MVFGFALVYFDLGQVTSDVGTGDDLDNLAVLWDLLLHTFVLDHFAVYLRSLHFVILRILSKEL
jgi:hypothetical protein